MFHVLFWIISAAILIGAIYSHFTPSNSRARQFFWTRGRRR
ncbi:MAG: hypothetical protein JWQ18_2138 [Conexibacter sp.]|nr:hypothetical protein [Conexibacter sp.]